MIGRPTRRGKDEAPPAKPRRMADRDGFRVAVKPSALDANGAVGALVADRGNPLVFDSRGVAEATAARLSDSGATRVVIQAAAPQDPDGVDAYLVASPGRRTHDPIEADDGSLTFETTAAQYGALGEALVCCYGANPPPLAAYVRRDLDDGEVGGGGDDRWIDLDRDPDPVVYATADGSTRLAWVPDCVARARDGPGGQVLESYYCEVKTGDASFQRDQATVMAYKACEATVLKIRVDVDGLPERYSARIEAVDPEEPPGDVSNLASPDARLDDFA